MKTTYTSKDFNRTKVVSQYGTTYRTEFKSSLGKATLVKVIALGSKRSPMNVGDLSLIINDKRYTTMADYINESDAWTKLSFNDQLRSCIEQAKLDHPVGWCCRILSLLEGGEFVREGEEIRRLRDGYHDDEDVCSIHDLDYLKQRIHDDVHRWGKMEGLEGWKVDAINRFRMKLGMATEE